MVRLPREEISYRRLYKGLDLDRELGIDWPETTKPAERATVDLDAHAPVTKRPRTLDEFDERFCRERNMDEDRLLGALEALDSGFDRLLFARLDRMERTSHPDQFCDVCGRRDQEEGNALFACTGCAIAVHQACYGILEPVGRFWFCGKCLFHGEEGSCFLCSNRAGILKRTTDLRWAHVVCAVLHPSLSFSNLPFKDPVDTSGLRRCRGRCGLCTLESDTLVRCAYFKCGKKYHASCAAEHLYSDLNNQHIYCPSHDFSSGSKMIVSRRRLVAHRNSYPLLEHDVFVRSARRLVPPAETPFSQIVKTEPFDVDGACPRDADVVAYWAAKRRAFGTSFSGVFLYVNYLNGQR